MCADGANVWRNFICGAAAGTLGVTTNNWADVICTRNRNKKPGVPALWTLVRLRSSRFAISPPRPLCRYLTAPPPQFYVWKTIREEGFGALYRGYVAKVSRLGPGGGIMIMVVDIVNGLLAKMFP